MGGSNKLRHFSFIEYIYAPGATILILAFIYAVKGLFPFGEMLIDRIDMSQYYIPFYYHLHDALHGKKNLFFDWYTACGLNMSQAVGTLSAFSPFNLFFYFVPRDYIQHSMSIFTALKITTCSATMYVFLRKAFSVNVYWKILMSLCYALSGFVLMYYDHSMWLDIVALFPLLLLSVTWLLRRGRIVPYVIMLSLCLIINLYCSYMILLYLFFTAGLYFIFLSEPEKRAEQIWKLGIGTIISLGISMIIVLPTFLQIGRSARIAMDTNVATILQSLDFQNSQKYFMLFGSILPIAIIIRAIVMQKRINKVDLFLICTILSVTLQICFESINLLWHGGSYVLFPMRFGYMVGFSTLCAACYYISKDSMLSATMSERFNSLRESFKDILKYALELLFMVFAFLLIVFFAVYSSDAGVMFMCGVLALAVYYVVLRVRNNHVYYMIISLLIIPSLILASYKSINIRSFTQETYPSEHISMIYTIQSLENEFQINKSEIDRMKNIGNTLNTNYPFIMKRAGISNLTHNVSEALQTNLKQLGYSTHFTRTLDSGGTIFSDALLNVKNTISTYPLDDELYRLIDQNDSYYYYENKYTLPLGVTIPKTSMPAFNETYSPFDYQNDIYQSLSGDGVLIERLDENVGGVSGEISSVSSSKNDVSYNIQVNGNQVLYLYFYQYKTVTIHVQGKTINIPSIENTNNTVYPGSFNNGMLCLGYFSDQTVSVRIANSGESDFSKDGILLALLDLDKFSALTEKYAGHSANEQITSNGISLEISDGSENDLLMLPIAYDKGWHCTVNGKKVDVSPAIGSFLGIQLEDGVNKINLTFIPNGLIVGGIISVCSILLLCFGFIFMKKTKKHLLFVKKCEGLLCCLYGVAVFVVYLIPIVATFFEVIRRAVTGTL